MREGDSDATGRRMSWVRGHHLLSLPFQLIRLPHYSVSSNGGTLHSTRFGRSANKQGSRPLVLNVLFIRQASASS